MSASAWIEWRCAFCGSSAEGNEYYFKSITTFGHEHQCSYPPHMRRPAPTLRASSQPLKLSRIAGGRRVA